MAPLPQKLDDSGGAPNLSRRKSNENVGFVAPHPVVQLLLRRSLNSLCICSFLPKGWSSIFNQMNILGVRYQCHHHLSLDIINHHLVYCSRFEVIEVYILPYLGKKTILCNGFMIFFPYLQNVGRRSCRGTPPETPPIAGPDIRIRTDGERQKLPKSMSDQRAE